MIKVSCPSCNAAYDVDEHRLPEDGLRMRCPKCSESFQVHRDCEDRRGLRARSDETAAAKADAGRDGSARTATPACSGDQVAPFRFAGVPRRSRSSYAFFRR
ncbi:MAG: zinc-ribbon domain-containing protein [Deltaproteobacteria bacterium]|nr:zinc-ribbon domain-containing protein [Deltaproteobacteria bacterium]